MTTIVIDEAKALELLQAEVDEKGADFIYKAELRVSSSTHVTCKYAEDGCPSCLIGRALFRAGVAIERLELLDQAYDGMSIGVVEADFDGEVELTEDAVAVFAAAQSVQDRGWSWGEALSRARRTASGEEDLG